MAQLENIYEHLYAAVHYGFIADETTREHVEQALKIVQAQWKAEREQTLNWRLIETAPRDDTEIIGLFYRKYDDSPATIYGPWTVAFDGKKWRSSWDGSHVIDHQSDFGTEYKEPDIQPTHWMPMPDISKVTEGTVLPRLGGIGVDWWAESVKQYRQIKKLKAALQDCVSQLGYFAEDDQPAILSALAKGRSALGEP